MTVITAANLRRLIPASAVAAVLAVSWFGSQPSIASNGGTGYNCGVKGIGYHDHGKVCPYRPFPGQGVGLIKFGVSGLSALTGNGKNDNSTVTKRTDTGATVKITVSTNPIDSGDTTSVGESRRHSNGHGHGIGHGRGEG